MLVGWIATIWRYPVKSMGGEELAEVSATERGLAGDRRFALIDGETGLVASAKHARRWDRLLDCRAAAVEDRVEITLPDGTVARAGTRDADRALSSLLGRDVTLSATAPVGATTEKHYPRVEGHPLAGRRVTGELGQGALPGTFFDYAPLHLLTTASLDQLRRLEPDHDFDPRRFRANLVVRTLPGLSGFVENEWLDTTLRVGDAVALRVTQPVPRCGIPTLPQGGLPRDLGVLRAVARHSQTAVPLLGGARWPTLGVYAELAAGDLIQVGDPVIVSDVGEPPS